MNGTLEGLLDLLSEPTTRVELLASWGIRVKSAEVTYVREDAGTRAVVGFSLIPDPESASVPGYVKVYENPERVRTIRAKWATLRPKTTVLGPGVRFLPEDRGVFFVFPNDSKLRRLPAVENMEKLKRKLTDSRLLGHRRVRGKKSSLTALRYRPEHRFVARADLGLIDDATGMKSREDLILRVFPDSRGAFLDTLMRDLARQVPEGVLPRPLGVLENGTIYLEERVEGREAEELLADMGVSARARSLARLLHSLNRAGPECLRPLSFRELTRQRIEEAQALTRGENGELFRQLTSRLIAAIPAPGKAGYIHGDLHLRQVLVRPDGRLVLIDHERARLGEGVMDAGHLLAELRVLRDERPALAEGANRFAGAFEAAWTAEADPEQVDKLSFARALGLLAAAGRRARKNRADETVLPARPLLEEALALLPATAQPSEGDIRWTALFPRKSAPWPARGRLSDGREVHGSFDPRTERLTPCPPWQDGVLSALKTFEGKGQIVAWRPGQRAVVRLEESPPRFVKLGKPKKIRHAVDLLRALEGPEPNPAVRLPRVLQDSAEQGWMILDNVPGRSLHERLRLGEAIPWRTLARGLRAFHCHPAREAIEISPPEDLDVWRSRVRSAFPDLSATVDAAFARVPVAAPGQDALIHRDLHDKNVMLGDDHDCGLIDIEGARRGAVERDLGNLLAHFELRRFQWRLAPSKPSAWGDHLLDAYEDVGGTVDHDAVKREKTRALFRLGCVYSFRRPWSKMAAALLSRLAGAGVLLLLALLASCTAFVPADEEEDLLARAIQEGKIQLGIDFLEKKQTVEIRGYFQGDRFIAKSVEVEKPDREVEVKGDIRAADPDEGVVVVGNMEFHVIPSTKLLGIKKETLEAADLPAFVGTFCKAEAVERRGRLELRKLRLRERKEGELDRIGGRIRSIAHKRRRVTIGGVPIRLADDVPILWDVQGVEAPPPDQRGIRPRQDPRLKDIVRVDDEDLRTGSGFRLTDNLVAGGEIQWDIEWRKNHNLRNDRERDRLIQEASAELELSFRPDDRFFAFTKFRLGRKFVIFDEQRNLDFNTRIDVNQAYFVALDVPVEGIALEVGRQKFDQGREWVMDDEIEGARLFFDLNEVLVEASVSKRFIDKSDREAGIVNYLVAAHFDPWEDANLFLYGLHREHGDLVDLDRTHVGLSFKSTFAEDDGKVWVDFSYVWGSEDDLDVEGYGFDVAGMYVFSTMDWEPSIYFDIAYGSGDDDPADGKDSSFRQTGLNDNNDKFNGVTSFRYLGELVRPEVSNLIVMSTGFGFRPYRKTSVDVMFHHYRQVKASTTIRRSRLRLDPQGVKRNLGWEVDIIVGLEAWKPLEMEVVLAYFHPGSAFGPSPDDAWFLTFQAEWNF